ncbi:MAG: hypothetical protein DDT30_01704 [Dehalococcoidia bacterium]|nr:hypothetical protein [Bacillota bacterium]
MQERIGNEHQTPMFPKGFGASHPIFIQAQMPFAVLIKGLNWPALQIHSDDLFGSPVHPIGDQHDISPGQRSSLEADDQPYLAQFRQACRHGKAPIGLLVDGHSPISIVGNEWHEIFHLNVRSLQRDRFPGGIPQNKAVRFQVAVLLQHAHPIFLQLCDYGHQLFCQIPAIEQHNAKRNFLLNRFIDQLDPQYDLGLKLLMPGFEFRVFQQDRIDFFMKPRSFFLLGRYLAPREMLLDKCFPLGELFITSIQAQVKRKAYGATHIMGGDRVMCQRIGAFTMVVMAVDIFKHVAYMFTQRVIYDQRRLAHRAAPRHGLSSRRRGFVQASS